MTQFLQYTWKYRHTSPLTPHKVSLMRVLQNDVGELIVAPHYPYEMSSIPKHDLRTTRWAACRCIRVNIYEGGGAHARKGALANGLPPSPAKHVPGIGVEGLRVNEPHEARKRMSATRSRPGDTHGDGICNICTNT